MLLPSSSLARYVGYISLLFTGLASFTFFSLLSSGGIVPAPRRPVEARLVARIPRPGAGLTESASRAAELAAAASPEEPATTTVLGDFFSSASSSPRTNQSIIGADNDEDIELDEEMLAILASWPAVAEAREQAGSRYPPGEVTAAAAAPEDHKIVVDRLPPAHDGRGHRLRAARLAASRGRSIPHSAQVAGGHTGTGSLLREDMRSGRLV